MRATDQPLLPCAALAATLLLVASAIAQTPSRASITGKVVSDDGRPLRNAQVLAVQPGGSFFNVQRTPADAEGRFELANLDPRPYRLVAHAPGYVLLDESQRRAYHRPGSVVTLTLARGGAITGTVTDSDGRPIVYLPVRAVPKSRAGAPPGLMFGGTMETSTDDRGVYRIYGLPPGDYLVRAGGKSSTSFMLEGYPA
jgi:protocatechuate 3,4-dioxygenase beta subunit